MHILIIEPGSTGHHLIYLEKIAKGYLDSGHNITLCTLAATHQHPLIKNLKSKYEPSVNLTCIPDEKYKDALTSKFSDMGRELKMRGIFKKAYKEINSTFAVDYIFLPYLDYCLYAIGLLGSPFDNTAWGGICMRPSFHYQVSGVIAPKPKLSKVKEFLFKRCLSLPSLKKLFTIDELLEKHVSNTTNKAKGKIQYIPDPAELLGNHTPKTARAKLGLSEDTKIILVYGALNERKGIQSLIETLNVSSKLENVHLLLVGKQSEGIKKYVQSCALELTRKKRIHTLDRFVDSEEQQLSFMASDIVWLGYQEHYTMSGVLVLAAISGKPIIGTRLGLIGWYINEKKIGLSIDTQDKVQIQSAIQQISSEIDSNSDLYKNEHFDNHNWGVFLHTLSFTENN